MLISFSLSIRFKVGSLENKLNTREIINHFSFLHKSQIINLSTWSYTRKDKLSNDETFFMKPEIKTWIQDIST